MTLKFKITKPLVLTGFFLYSVLKNKQLRTYFTSKRMKAVIKYTLQRIVMFYTLHTKWKPKTTFLFWLRLILTTNTIVELTIKGNLTVCLLYFLVYSEMKRFTALQNSSVSCLFPTMTWVSIFETVLLQKFPCSNWRAELIKWQNWSVIYSGTQTHYKR